MRTAGVALIVCGAVLTYWALHGSSGSSSGASSSPSSGGASATTAPATNTNPVPATNTNPVLGLDTIGNIYVLPVNPAPSQLADAARLQAAGLGGLSGLVTLP